MLASTVGWRQICTVELEASNNFLYVVQPRVNTSPPSPLNSFPAASLPPSTMLTLSLALAPTNGAG